MNICKRIILGTILISSMGNSGRLFGSESKVFLLRDHGGSAPVKIILNTNGINFEIMQSPGSNFLVRLLTAAGWKSETIATLALQQYVLPSNIGYHEKNTLVIEPISSANADSIQAFETNEGYYIQSMDAGFRSVYWVQDKEFIEAWGIQRIFPMGDVNPEMFGLPVKIYESKRENSLFKNNQKQLPENFIDMVVIPDSDSGLAIAGISKNKLYVFNEANEKFRVINLSKRPRQIVANADDKSLLIRYDDFFQAREISDPEHIKMESEKHVFEIFESKSRHFSYSKNLSKILQLLELDIQIFDSDTFDQISSFNYEGPDQVVWSQDNETIVTLNNLTSNIYGYTLEGRKKFQIQIPGVRGGYKLYSFKDQRADSDLVLAFSKGKQLIVDLKSREIKQVYFDQAGSGPLHESDGFFYYLDIRGKLKVWNSANLRSQLVGDVSNLRFSSKEFLMADDPQGEYLYLTDDRGILRRVKK